MLRRFLPREYSFFDFFESHSQLTIRTCKELLSLTSGKSDMAESVRRIRDLEHEADKITTHCIEALQKTFITPIERTDIHQLIKRLDDIVDIINGASSRILLYEIKEMRPEARELAHILVLASGEIDGALKGLRNLKNIRLIKERCTAIHELENQGDEVLRSALMRLIKENQPMLFIKWKEIFERLEKAINRSKDVADMVEEIVIAST
jgi:predicted phosphate transport protein (TIGR00153 family)